MGTTQRLIPGVTGEPNWGNLNVAITSIANTVSKELEIEAEVEKAVEKQKETPSEANEKILEKLNAVQRKLHDRRIRNFRSGLQSLIKTGGGRTNIAKGKSSSLGRAGLRTSKNFSNFVLSVHTSGLTPVLKELGFAPLEGKKLQEVIDFLLIYFADTSSGMDEVAANMASCEIIEILTTGIKTVEAFEKKLQSLVEDNTLTELLCKFYGLYLFEHLSQRFQEKITQIKGESVSMETFKVIKEDILEQIKVINSEKKISEINWKGKDGKELEEKIFNSIIQIFE